MHDQLVWRFPYPSDTEAGSETTATWLSTTGRPASMGNLAGPYNDATDTGTTTRGDASSLDGGRDHAKGQSGHSGQPPLARWPDPARGDLAGAYRSSARIRQPRDWQKAAVCPATSNVSATRDPLALRESTQLDRTLNVDALLIPNGRKWSQSAADLRHVPARQLRCIGDLGRESDLRGYDAWPRSALATAPPAFERPGHMHVVAARNR